MFAFKRRVFLKEVDATGVIYFAVFFEYALEAFELFLQDRKTSLSEFLSKEYLFPVVHAESDYRSPIKVSDELLLSLSIKKISTRSVTVETNIRNLSTGEESGRVLLVHAFLRKGQTKSSEIPQEILSIFQ